MTGPSIKEAILWFFSELNSERISYAVLRKAELIPDRVGNDIDILVAPSEISHIKEIVLRCAEAHGFRVYERTNAGGYYPIIYGFTGGRPIFFRLDFANQIRNPDALLQKRLENEKGIYYIPEGLHTKIRKSNIKNFLTYPWRLLFPPGKFVVILGPDGVGKSTAAEGAAKLLEVFHVPVSHMHLGFRPRILPTKKAIVSLGRQKSVLGEESHVPGFFRFLYHTLDHFLGYWFVVRPSLVKGRMMIGERYYYSYLVDPRPRKRYGVPSWMFRLAFFFMPKPDMVVMLSHDPEAVHERRQEHSVEEIARQLLCYRELGMKAKKFLEIKTDISPDGVSEALATQLAPKRHKLAVVASHPIQYQSPLWREIAKNPDIDLVVYYCVNWGVTKPQFHKDFFSTAYKWDIPLLEGYKYKFLRNYSLKPRPVLGGFINPGIFWELGNERYDAVLVLGWMDVTFWFAFLASKLTSTPAFLRVVNSSRYDRRVKRNRLLLALKRVYLHTLFHGFVSRFLAIGTWNREMYLEYGIPENRIFHFPYAVWNEFFMKETKKNNENAKEIRRETGIKEKGVVVTFAARLVNEKHPEHALRAYAKALKAVKKDLYLLIVGDGPMKAELEKEVMEKNIPNVIFTGFKNQTELVRLYAITDIFVRADGCIKGDWGATVNEAMASGLPVIAPDTIGAQADLVHQGENGFTYPFNDIEVLSERITEIASNEKLMFSMKKKSLDIISGWSYKEDVEGLLEALESLSKSKID